LLSLAAWDEAVDADSKDDEYGLTPLLWAAWSGHETVMKQLLERDDVEADSKDKLGRTPLSWASRRGHDAVVKLLQDHNSQSS
jgi:ankyrin repeat protein